MKKETLITAVVFLGVGFLAGFAFNAHRNSRQRLAAASTQAAAQADSAASPPVSDPSISSGAGVALSSDLPKGHPQITDAQVIQFFKDASARNPSEAAPRLKLANFLYDRHRFDEAISWYRQALTLDPANADARTDMATCYFSLGNAREAVDQLNQALKSDPRHAPALFNLVVVEMEGLHNDAAAKSALRRLTAINPDYPGIAPLEQALNESSRAPQGAAVAP